MKNIKAILFFQLLLIVGVGLNSICLAQTNCITCQSNTTSTATGSGAVSFGGNNSSTGSRSTTFGYSNTASGTNSLAFGQLNLAAGLNSLAAGKSSVTTSNAYYSIAFGYNAKSSGFNSYVFGTGVDEDEPNQINFSYLENNTNNSFLVGFNSFPSFFVKGPNSPQGINDSKVGIGTIDPLQSLDIYGAIKIGNSSTNHTGSIRWTGSDFEGYNGSSWKSFTSGENWLKNGNSTYYLVGNVGIGTSSPDLNTKLDIRGYTRVGSTDGMNYIKMGFDGLNNHLDAHGTGIMINYYTPNSPLAIFSKTIFSPESPIVSWSNIYIGIDDPLKTAGYRLAVAGKIIAEEVRVKLTTNWPDYVFEKDYNLISLDSLESYISINNHLPGVHSNVEIRNQENNIDLGEMNAILLRKIEELTLYIIEQEKRISKIEKK